MRFLSQLIIFCGVLGFFVARGSADESVLANSESSQKEKKNGRGGKPLKESQSDESGGACAGQGSSEDRGVPLEKGFVEFKSGGSKFGLKNKLYVEATFGKNLYLANDAANFSAYRLPAIDKLAWIRTTFDSKFSYSYKMYEDGEPLISALLGTRARGIWGDEQAILSTNENVVDFSDFKLGNHSHEITRHVFWIRELWMNFSVQEALGLRRRHDFTMGFFPFSVGRGIAFGDAYVVDVDWLGDFSALAIDQFAPGLKLSGDLSDCGNLAYDLYYELADSRVSDFGSVNFPLYRQQYGRRDTPERGYEGFSHYFVGRLLYKPIDEDCKRVAFEPYAFHLNRREQKLAFLGEADMHLSMFGFALELEWGDFEMGFDTAFSFGRQRVRGWDRNDFTLARNSAGLLEGRYTEVEIGEEGSDPKDRKPAPINDDVKKVVDDFDRYGEEYNGQAIGTVGDGGDKKEVYNGRKRFHDPQVNDLNGGVMMVGDLSYCFKNIDCFKDNGLTLALTGGFASGDEDPNKDLYFEEWVSPEKRSFSGFIPQQELYQGHKVRSIVFLSGRGRLPRPLSAPASSAFGENFESFPEEYPTNVGHFTNIILAGASVRFQPQIGCFNFDVRSNVLGFWSYIRPRIPEAKVGGNIEFDFTKKAGRYFGTEWNLLLETSPLKDFLFFLQFGIFKPGSFYESFSGIPLRRGQKLFGVPEEQFKVTNRKRLGADTLYYLNVGFKLVF